MNADRLRAIGRKGGRNLINSLETL
ncbi:MAG: KGG domain-containing protein [Minisyncoccota bacterium]